MIISFLSDGRGSLVKNFNDRQNTIALEFLLKKTIFKIIFQELVCNQLFTACRQAQNWTDIVKSLPLLFFCEGKHWNNCGKETSLRIPILAFSALKQSM